MLKAVFAENRHPRFMKEFSFHDPTAKANSTEKQLKQLTSINSRN